MPGSSANLFLLDRIEATSQVLFSSTRLGRLRMLSNLPNLLKSHTDRFEMAKSILSRIFAEELVMLNVNVLGSIINSITDPTYDQDKFSIFAFPENCCSLLWRHCNMWLRYCSFQLGC